MKLVLLGVLLIAVVMWLLPAIPLNFFTALIVIVFGFFFATVSSRMVGLIGSSNNPVSGMAIATLLISTMLLKATGNDGIQGMIAAIVIGGIIGGVFTATEGSAIAVIYALILGILYRNITLKSFWKIAVDSAKMSGMIVFLIGVSNILGWVMAFLQIPDAVAAALLSLTSNKYVILLIMNVILLVSGTFMDVTPAILIFTPLFLPICQSFGMSTIQFGLILVYNLCIGNITPPVGNALFVGIKVGRTSLSKVMPYMLMYYVAIIGGLLLVTFIPAVSTALPQAMGLM